jgi:membrane fusion protein (multidrug efflux system)
MTRKIILTLVGVLLLVALIGGIKALQIKRMIDAGAGFAPPPVTVTSVVVSSEKWEELLFAVGSLEAVQGVIVAAESPGKIAAIPFVSGTRVEKGDLLLQQDVSTETAQLPGAEAAVVLARNNLKRADNLLAQKFISQAEYDAAFATFREASATADNLRAVIAKKSIRAPFSGRLGIRLVDVGQVLKEGDPIVSLQDADPIFANFFLPQQNLAQIRTGQTIRVSTSILQEPFIEGKITATNPQVDAATRNLRIQATLDNPDELLRPGMYVDVAVLLPERPPLLAIPATAVLYAPYSDSVFVIEEKVDEKSGQSSKVMRQQFVTLGEKRGDFVAVSDGLREGESVVSTGVFKLRNGQAVTIDNTLTPEFELAPKPENK